MIMLIITLAIVVTLALYLGEGSLPDTAAALLLGLLLAASVTLVLTMIGTAIANGDREYKTHAVDSVETVGKDVIIYLTDGETLIKTVGDSVNIRTGDTNEYREYESADSLWLFDFGQNPDLIVEVK